MESMMWFMDKKLPLSQNIKDAVSHYNSKYGKAEHVLCSPADYIKADDLEDVGVMVKSSKTVLPNCLWIGSEILN